MMVDVCVGNKGKQNYYSRKNYKDCKKFIMGKSTNYGIINTIDISKQRNQN